MKNFKPLTEEEIRQINQGTLTICEPPTELFWRAMVTIEFLQRDNKILSLKVKSHEKDREVLKRDLKATQIKLRDHEEDLKALRGSWE